MFLHSSPHTGHLYLSLPLLRFFQRLVGKELLPARRLRRRLVGLEDLVLTLALAPYKGMGVLRCASRCRVHVMARHGSSKQPNSDTQNYTSKARSTDAESTVYSKVTK